MNRVKQMYNTFKKVLPSSLKYKSIFIVTFISSLVQLLGIFLFSFVGIDYAFKNNDKNAFILILVLSFIIYLISNLTTYKINKISNRICLQSNKDLRERLFKKLIEADKEYYLNNSTGSMLHTLMSDTNVISNYLFTHLKSLITTIVDIIVYFILAMVIDFKLALVVFLVSPIIYLITKFSFKSFFNIAKEQKEINREVTSYINDSIMGIRTIKTLGINDIREKEYEELKNKQIRCSYKRFGMNQIMWRSVDLLTGLSLCLIFYLSYRQSVSSYISYGSLYVFFHSISILFSLIGNTPNLVHSFNDCYESALRIEDILELEPTIKDNKDSINLDKIQGNIEFKDVDFIYPRGNKVLESFNLRINEKDKIALVGRTGSGKSTIASLLYRFYIPSKGKILIDGKDYLTLSNKSIRDNIGFILQDSYMFDDTILNNIRYGNNNASLDKVKEVCKKLGIDDFIESMENKYETRVGEGGLILSLGEKQLISLARVLLKNPDIIILDEATSSIDSKSEKLIQNCIEKEFKDKTCIYIAHRLSTITSCNKIIYLDNGKVIESGTHLELMNKKGEYYKLYSSQFYSEKLDIEQGLAK